MVSAFPQAVKPHVFRLLMARLMLRLPSPQEPCHTTPSLSAVCLRENGIGRVVLVFYRDPRKPLDRGNTARVQKVR